MDEPNSGCRSMHRTHPQRHTSRQPSSYGVPGSFNAILYMPHFDGDCASGGDGDRRLNSMQVVVWPVVRRPTFAPVFCFRLSVLDDTNTTWAPAQDKLLKPTPGGVILPKAFRAAHPLHRASISKPLHDTRPPRPPQTARRYGCDQRLGTAAPPVLQIACSGHADGLRSASLDGSPIRNAICR